MATGEHVEPVVDYVITVHAALEMKRRGLSEDTIRSVPAAPGQQLEARPGRVILQSKLSSCAQDRVFLVRVFVDVDRRPVEVVTAYRTTKIEKYWRQP